MCGIVGFARGKHKQQSKAMRAYFEQALYVDALRGMDATGVWVQKFDGKQSWYKAPMPAAHYLELKPVAKLLDKADWNCSAAIGHNRAGTVGRDDVNNAHPFIWEDVTLVHNGTLTRYHQFDVHPESDTDSARVAVLLGKAEPTNKERKRVLESLTGAYAFVWHDARTNTLHMARNEERPLHYMPLTSKEHKGDVLFASEFGMLWFCARRADLLDADSKGYAVPAGKLMTWDLSRDELKVKVSTFQVKKEPIISGSRSLNSVVDLTGKNISTTGTNGGSTSNDAPTDSKRAVETNDTIKMFGVEIRCNDIVDGYPSQWHPYHSQSERGYLEAWLDNEETNDLVELRIHGVEKAIWETYALTGQAGDNDVDIETVQMKVKSATVEADPRGRGGEWLVLSGTFAGLGKHFRAHQWEDPMLGEWFNGLHHYQNGLDQPYIPIGTTGDTLTERECDMLTAGSTCSGCGEHATAVPFESVNGLYCEFLQDSEADGKGDDEIGIIDASLIWECAACQKAAAHQSGSASAPGGKAAPREGSGKATEGGKAATVH